MIDNIKNYMKVAGVWAICGKIKGKNEIVWLNVAKTSNIGDEVKQDILFMSKEFSNQMKEKAYISKWNEELFLYKDFQYSPRRIGVWKNISKYIEQKCEGFEVICVSKEESKNLGKIEREFAFYTKALFWSDRKHYSCSEIDVEKRRNKFNNDNRLDDKFQNGKYDIIYSNIIKKD